MDSQKETCIRRFEKATAIRKLKSALQGSASSLDGVPGTTNHKKFQNNNQGSLSSLLLLVSGS